MVTFRRTLNDSELCWWLFRQEIDDVIDMVCNVQQYVLQFCNSNQEKQSRNQQLMVTIQDSSSGNRSK